MQLAKRALGEAAARIIKDGMRVGLGSGSTSRCFIEALGKRVQEEGLQIIACASSSDSSYMATSYGIPLVPLELITPPLDITVDGADEVDSVGRLVKGGGGAHVREQLIASISHEVLILVDDSKLVSQLGRFPLPLAVLPCAKRMVEWHLAQRGLHYAIRALDNGSPVFSDDGHILLDVHFNGLRESPEEDHRALAAIAGVVATGFCFNFATSIWVSSPTGAISCPLFKQRKGAI